jgi:hypothetical protein
MDTDTKTKVEAAYKELYTTLQAVYMEEGGNTDAILNNLLQSGDAKAVDGFKNLLLGKYKEYIYETTNYPFFTCEDTFIMEELERIIKSRFGEDFFNYHRLDQQHWMFANGAYSYFFAPDFIQAVY